MGCEYFDILEERGHVGVWTWNLVDDELDWSDGLYRLFGLVPGHGRPTREFFHSMIHPEDRPLQLKRAQAMRDGLALSFDFRLIRPNGSVRWMTTKTESLSDRDGRPVRVVGIVLDITARKRLEGELGASTERFKALAAAAGGLVFAAHTDGSAELLSDPQGLFEGALMDGLESWIDLLAPEDRPPARHAWERAVAHGEPLEIDCRLASGEVDGHSFRVHMTPVASSDGQTREWLGLCRDFGLAGLGSVAGEEAHQPTGAQLRAARGILNWSVRELAEAADISVSTIRRLEEMDGAPPSFEPKLAEVQKALEAAGVEFIFPQLGQPAVRPR
ncbi:PAS domain-containing protein [Lutibaculum baratangense]|uniref:histidine kinase n=1 Tax=Lutibaculum baratangense AMV1 TaxID=631454 RepID=V4RFP9_9HYPH|nr:PAS domain-containing protein [Lutibaculum baratangense]ESR24209.1 PAS/PAC sensor hybrid histidine kinase [Lutibaculum baratangense AMV1]